MALPWHQTSEEKRRFQRKGTRAAQTLTSIWASALRACTRLRFRSTSESKSPEERSKMREWSFWGVQKGRSKAKEHLSAIQQISIFKIPNSAVKFQGKWRASGKRGFVLIWNVTLCAYFVQDFLFGGQIILHPKQTLLFLLVTALQLIITSHTTITNERVPPLSTEFDRFQKKSIKMKYKINIYKSINMLMLFYLRAATPCVNDCKSDLIFNQHWSAEGLLCTHFNSKSLMSSVRNN